MLWVSLEDCEKIMFLTHFIKPTLQNNQIIIQNPVNFQNIIIFDIRIIFSSV